MEQITNYNIVVKLSKVTSTHNRLRTQTINGVANKLPELNKSFSMLGESLDSGGLFRYIETSLVKKIVNLPTHSRPDRTYLNRITFKTENSEYLLEVLGEKE